MPYFWAILLCVVVVALIGFATYAVGYLRGRADGQSATLRSLEEAPAPKRRMRHLSIG